MITYIGYDLTEEQCARSELAAVPPHERYFSVQDLRRDDALSWVIRHYPHLANVRILGWDSAFDLHESEELSRVRAALRAEGTRAAKAERVAVAWKSLCLAERNLSVVVAAYNIRKMLGAKADVAVVDSARAARKEAVRRLADLGEKV